MIGVREALVKDHALKMVNAIREAFGHASVDDLPMGVPGDGCRCPVALALEDCGVVRVDPNLTWESIHDAIKAMRAMKEEGGNVYLAERDDCMVVIDGDFATFIHWFDTGKYPEMIVDA
jgi:hypothetical protein